MNLQDIDCLAVGAINPAQGDEVIVIDEIGKMECFSMKFRGALTEILDSPNWVIGSIAQKGDAFIQGIKERADVIVINVTPQNRDILAGQILDYLI